MLYKISNVNDKSKDWKVVSIKGVDGSSYDDVSINRTSKDNKLFPNFDGIVDGVEVEGNYWQSSVGKKYLFAPKEFKGRVGGNSATITKAMDRKEKSIETFQGKKENSIAYNVALNTSSAVVVAMINAGLIKPTSIEDVNDLIIQHRDTWLAQWDAFNEEIPS